MEDSHGIRIALSPVQLATVLSDQSVSEGETLSNRLWGGLGLAGGVAEMFGAGVMCVVPEPTMLTKAGCVIVGTHSLDTVQASIQQIWSGNQTNTDTYNSAVALAVTLGADAKTAMNVGMTVDLAIPMGFAIAVGAVRVAAVRGGRIKLAEHESVAGRHPGGHTLERHIGKTPDELLARLERRPGLPATSSFRNTADAEALTTKVLRANKNQIEYLVKYAPQNLNSRKTFVERFGHKTGIAVNKGSRNVQDCYRVSVTIELTWYHGKPFFVLTSFPMV
ncbi:RNase A-like domain-containing protein [Brenneria tiliae]|uniref:RNase A-like domain-containing protein n=1 Tax=Brenneria tiliae TaxID=2914984 RepID=UPI002014B179|nr:RNase A-like domain-containing protein [Brenneria tiliae]MCL2899173.1 hypothetical protein [Brenneria tiliae]MCL2903551.1 hypothetical protein [Brenneria tiliae]